MQRAMCSSCLSVVFRIFVCFGKQPIKQELSFETISAVFRFDNSKVSSSLWIKSRTLLQQNKKSKNENKCKNQRTAPFRLSPVSIARSIPTVTNVIHAVTILGKMILQPAINKNGDGAQTEKQNKIAHDDAFILTAKIRNHSNTTKQILAKRKITASSQSSSCKMHQNLFR